MLRALEICTSSSYKEGHRDGNLEDCLPAATLGKDAAVGGAQSAATLHGGHNGQKRHLIPVGGRFLANEERREGHAVDDGAAFRDSLIYTDSSICSSQPEGSKGSSMMRMAEQDARSRPPASSMDIKGILPSNGIRPVGGGVRLALMVEDAVWPEYALCDSRSWASHQRCLEPDGSRPGINVQIAKTEVRGPKSSPYAVYIMHIRTAFSVRGIARRYSEFRELDTALRASFASLPPLPGRRVFGRMSVQLVAERRRYLQEYLDNVLADHEMACSDPVLSFLQIHGHETEENIVFGSSHDLGRQIWDMPAGAPTEGVEQLLDTLRTRGDKRQEARTENCLGLMYAERGAHEKAIPMMQGAIETCRSGLSRAQARQSDSPDDKEIAEEVEFWSTGMVVCISNLGCILSKTGHSQGALERFREGVAVGGELGDIGFQANCLGKICMVLASKGDIHGAVKVGAGAMEMWEASGDNQRMAAMSLALAAMHLSRGEVKQAVELLEGSLMLSRRARDKIRLAEGLHALGTCFARIGYHAHALEHLQQALALCREIGDRIGEARCLCVLGYVLLSQRDNQRSLHYYDASLRLFDSQGDLFGQVACHEGMSKARRAMGQDWLADAHIDEAAAIRNSPAGISVAPQDFSRDIVDSPSRPGLASTPHASPQKNVAASRPTEAPDIGTVSREASGFEDEELLGGHSRGRRSRRMAGERAGPGEAIDGDESSVAEHEADSYAEAEAGDVNGVTDRGEGVFKESRSGGGGAPPIDGHIVRRADIGGAALSIKEQVEAAAFLAAEEVLGRADDIA